MAISVVILAAGAGTRMKSSTPKVLHTISGKEMLYYAIKEAKELSDDVTVVLYHQAQKVQQAMEKYFDDVTFVLQDHQNFPGTGGAMMGVKVRHEKVLVLNGDMPLVTHDELLKLTQIDAPIVMSALSLNDASGYGRVITEGEKVVGIVEQKDALPHELDIKLANAGVYLFSKESLTTYLPQLSNKNAQSEYYLTDVVGLGVKQGLTVRYVIVNEEHFKGVNSKLDL